MRTTILCILLFCVYALDTKAQTIEPEVNENVELMSILARMAGYPEYNMDMAGQYIKTWMNILRVKRSIRLCSI